MIIVFEGLDGSGKGTQIKMLKDKLKCSVQNYPDRTGIYGYLFEKILKKKINVDMSGYELLPMFLMDMIKDKSKLEKYKGSETNHIILDRYAHSTLAYQTAQGIIYEKGKAMIEEFELIEPDILFVLDVDPSVCISRIEGEKELFEKEEFLKKVRKNYIKIYEECFFADVVVSIDGQQDLETVHSTILAILNDYGV
ncbi:MAG: dTMP kinase [Bacteroidales bacterium]|jgi:dTMP kinase|nr:dTMP kinase [Bacteroidales bacterium]